MARKRIIKGYSNFKHIVGNNGYFVDKTLFIKEFYENSDHVLVIPRPRRFGKTLNLSMIEYFFDIRKKADAGLFEGYQISKNKTFCQQHQNQYPVINISLKNATGGNWEECFSLIKGLLAELYKTHSYLLKSDKLEDFDKITIKKILLEQGNYSDCVFSLKNLSKFLKKYFGQETIILVDEYDTPIIDGYHKQYYDRVIGFMRNFLGAAFKGNPHLRKGLITGIMRIAKESIFSQMNNPGVYTVLDPYFSDKFGFTETDIKEILMYFDLSDALEDVKKWYDGYKFGNQDGVYNPWSIVNFIARYEQGFKAYWVNTGTDALVKKRIIQPDANKTYNTLQQLISGETIQEKIYENFVFTDFKTKKSLLWTLLTFSGYLTQVRYIAKSEEYLLKIPNYEIQKVFKEIVLDWWEIQHNVVFNLLNTTARHLINNRLKAFEKGFKEIIGDTFSYFDADGEAEKIYQAYVLGLLAILGDDYIIRSNRESGEGRYDILMIPHDKQGYGVVIELKQLKRKKKEAQKTFVKRVNQLLAKAKNQIEQNQYYKELIAHRIEKIIKLPIVFAGKEPVIFPMKEIKEEVE